MSWFFGRAWHPYDGYRSGRLSSYDQQVAAVEQAEAARLAEIRRKAEANEAAERARSVRSRTLGLDRPGHSL